MIAPVSNAVLTRNVAALAEAGVSLPADVLRTPEDADLLLDRGVVVGVALRTPAGSLPMQATAYPAREAEAWIPDATLAASTVVVVGAGAGHLIEALERRGYRGRILVIEPSPGSVVAALARHDWRALIRARRLRWLVAPAYDGWTDAWSWLTPGEAPGIVIHPVLGTARPQDVRAALELVKKLVFNAGANEAARQRFAGPYLLNTLENLPHLLRSHDVRDLDGRFTGVPAVIAAAGPSLNRNLEELAPVRDRALLVSVDTALRPCLAAGIEPDIVVAVDPGPLNRRHLTVGAAPPRTWLVAEPSLAPGSFEAFGDRLITYRVGDHEPWPWLRRNGVDRGSLRAWGSVLTTALDLAVCLGCDPIILIGADFGYTNGQPYCRGTAYEEDWARELAEYGSLDAVWEARWRATATVEEAGLDGQPVRATPQLLAFRDWIAGYCARQTSARVVNATGAGLMRALPTATPAEMLEHRPPRVVDLALGDVQPVTRPLEADGFDTAGTGDWARWSALVDTPLTLMRLIDEDVRPGTPASRQKASSRFAALAQDADPDTRAVALWQALHATGYFEQHPRYRQPMWDLGVDTARRLLDLRTDDVLLDVGCGYGRMLWYLAPLVARAIAYEIAPEPLALARRYLKDRGHVEFVLGDGHTLAPIPDATATAILVVTVLPFMSRSGIGRLLEEVARVLVPGGRACLQFHHDGPRHVDRDDDDPEERARFAEPRQPSATSHDEADVRRLASEAGLVTTEVVRESLDRYHPGYDMAWLWARCEKPREALRG